MWRWEWACDGVEMRKFMMHSMQVFPVRCKEAAASFACRKRNVAPIMIVPGPKGPKKQQWRTLWWLLFDCTGAVMLVVTLWQSGRKQGVGCAIRCVHSLMLR